MTGTWKAIDIEIYEVDDLGNPGSFIAMARDQRVAARMADAHNSMLAALRKMTDGITGKTGPLGDEDYDEFIEPIIDEAKAAIAKAEGTKP